MKNKEVLYDLTTGELAEILGCSRGTIYSWSKKGLEKRKELFDKENTYLIDDVLEFLRLHEKYDYIDYLEIYLCKDAVCRECNGTVSSTIGDGYSCNCGLISSF